MHFLAPPISHHRLTRFHRWAMLWLSWFAAFLEAAAEFAPISTAATQIGHRWLDRVERLLVCILIIRAGAHIAGVHPRKGVSEHRRNDTARFRAIIGARLRRALRSKDLHQRIEALRQDIDALVAHLMRRLPRGLTRRRPILPRPEARCADAPSIFVLSAVCADTS